VKPPGERLGLDSTDEEVEAMTATQMESGDSLRDTAILRLRKKREFRVHLMAYVVVNAALVTIWALTSRAYFWPVFPMLGWGIGVVFHAWDAYARPDLSEEQIAREMRRLSGRKQGEGSA
jgi:uncharacterized membrane protein